MNRRQAFGRLFGLMFAAAIGRITIPSIASTVASKDAFSESDWRSLDFRLPREPRFVPPPKLPQFVIDMMKEIKGKPSSSDWDCLTSVQESDWSWDARISLVVLEEGSV